MMRIRNILALMGTGFGLYFATNEYRKRRSALDLHGKVALITGGSRGLGLAMARAFADEGARLVICAREQEALELARAELASSGAEVLAVPCDVTDRAQVQRLIEQSIAHFGQIDVLVNNAGIITVGPVKTMTLHDYEESMNIMFWGGVYTTL